MYSLDDMFNEALDEFKSRVGKENCRDFEKTDIKMLKKELNRMQQDQRGPKTLRNLRRIQGFVKAFEQFGSVVEVFLNASPFVCYVWGPVKFLLVIARNSVDHLDMILDAWEKIAEEMPMLIDYQDTFRENQSLQEILVQIFADVLEFHQHAITFFSGRALTQVLKAVWKSFKPRFDHILARLRSHRELLENKIRTINSRSLNEYIRQYSLDMQLLQDRFVEAEKDRVEKQHDQLQAWIASPDVEREHLEIQFDLERYPRSGDWILSQEKIRDWLGPDVSTNSMLWISGNPGTGKTYLASIIIQSCKGIKPETTSYFYCSDKSNDRNTATSILKGLLSQLVRQNRELVPYCLERKNNSASPSLSAFPLAKSLIETICIVLPPVYIVVDGMDECQHPGDRKLLVDTFSSLVKTCDGHSPGKLRVLALSRSFSEVDRTSLPLCIDHFSLAPENSEKDIERYCKVRFHREYGLQKLKLLSEELETAVKIICLRANGMFLFARLVIENLAKMPSRESFFYETVSQRFPKDLNAAYSKIMERLENDLSEQQFAHTKRLLGWLVRSKRPLKWSEIKVASSINLDTGDEQDELNSDRRLCDRMEDLCGSLVQVLPGDRVELVHSTARLYIASQSKIDIRAAECDLNLRCLRYLTSSIFREEIEEEYLGACALRGDFAFQDYAVSAWFMHLRTFVEAKYDSVVHDASASDQFLPARPGTFAYEIDRFVRVYNDAFATQEISVQARQDCDNFRDFSFHEPVLRVWNHVCVQQAKDIKSRGKVSIELLSKMVTRNRQLLEGLSVSHSESQKVREQYGSRLFKCQMVFCFYFHEGFANKKIRDKHVDCHERPFQCEVEECGISGLGLASHNALQRHMRTFHPEQCDLSESFAQLSRKGPSSTSWPCPFCDKTFTRSHNLESHKLNHQGKKPFPCSECGKGFARKNDVRRHEEIHNRRR